jgi:hypothetical protein
MEHATKMLIHGICHVEYGQGFFVIEYFGIHLVLKVSVWVVPKGGLSIYEGFCWRSYAYINAKKLVDYV